MRQTAAREVQVLEGLVHDNVVRLLDAFSHAGRLYLVFELAEQTVLQARMSPAPVCSSARGSASQGSSCRAECRP